MRPEDSLARCDLEETYCLDQVMKNEMWVIGFVDWNVERRLILEELVKDAVRTEPDYTLVLERLQDVRTVRLLHVAMGLATEAGEFVDALKKHIFYGKKIDDTNLVEELGDTSWYQRVGCAALEVEFALMLRRNVDKLKTRFPEKFTEDRAINRDLGAERTILERES